MVDNVWLSPKNIRFTVLIFFRSRHQQGQGTHLPAIKVSEWAKRPFEKQDLFIVGEAYQPLIWIEGALQSAQNALHEGWNIDNVRQRRELTQESSVNNKMDSTLVFP